MHFNQDQIQIKKGKSIRHNDDVWLVKIKGINKSQEFSVIKNLILSIDGHYNQNLCKFIFDYDPTEIIFSLLFNNNSSLSDNSTFIVEQQKKLLLKQIELYINGKISKETYNSMAENYFSFHSNELENTDFETKFLELIPKACTMYIDEPCFSGDNDYEFFVTISKAYNELKNL